MSSLTNQQPPLLEDVINKMRDNILRSQSQSNTAAITGFDNMVEQLKIFVNQINSQSKEIERLQKLCTKNKIDYSIPPKIPHKGEIAQSTPEPPKTK